MCLYLQDLFIRDRLSILLQRISIDQQWLLRSTQRVRFPGYSYDLFDLLCRVPPHNRQHCLRRGYKLQRDQYLQHLR